MGTNFSLDGSSDIAAIQLFAQELDESGFDFVGLGGHVLTAASGRYPERPVFTYANAYHDPFVLFAYLAAGTTRLRFRSSVLLLPMFPTVLVAKQAAELALVSGDRFELGVGIGWHEDEYNAMGQQLRGRHIRFEEQIALLRRLWTEEFVTMHGRHHHIDELGIGTRPTQPIPILIGCGSQPALLERVGRVADGWLPIAPLTAADVAAVNAAATAAGRPAPTVTGRLVVGGPDPDAVVAEAQRLFAEGATELALAAAPGTAPDAVLSTLIDARTTLAAALTP